MVEKYEMKISEKDHKKRFICHNHFIETDGK